MEFRPCIDIHNGKVKQIVGSSLKDEGNLAKENYVSKQDSVFYAKMYREDGIKGGHIILLNPSDSSYYEATKQQAVFALHAYPKGLQVGGGITAENASYFLEEGASHVIVTSYVFKGGEIHYENLKKLVEAVGKEHIVLDLSCRYVAGEEPGYYIVTDRWQNITGQRITAALLDELSEYCDEFLVHAVDVEGKQNGIEKPLVSLLGDWGKCPITYAGGISCIEDLDVIRMLGKGRLHVTIGSALDLFGGKLSYQTVLEYMRNDGSMDQK